MGKAMLVIILGFSMIFSAVRLNVSTQHARSMHEIARLYEHQLARNAASSAANMAVAHLYNNFGWRTGYASVDFGAASASVQAADVTTDPRTGVPTASVTSVGSYYNVTDTSKAVLIQPAYSYFGLWLKDWPAFWTLTNGDTFSVPIHSNQKIHISGIPVFYGRVSSDESWYQDDGGADPRFLGGAEFRSPTILDPTFTAVIDSGYAGGDTVFTSNATLVFNGDGTYKWYAAGDSGIQSIGAGNGIIVEDGGDAYVRGVVDGQVTVASNRDIYIEGSLTGAVSPEGNPSSDDLVALLAERDVIVVDNADNSAGVTLHASVAARGKLKVENYNSGSARGNLRLVGSLVSGNLDPFGTWSGGVLQTGYRFVLVADRRLRNRRAPYYPLVTGWTEVLEWTE